jgi:hypothetical protein
LAQLRPGRAEAAAAVWSWRDAPAQRRIEDPAAARRRGLIRAVVLGVAAVLLIVLWSALLGKIALLLASAVLMSAIFSPTGAYLAFERALAALAHFTGLGLTWILMPAIFFLVVVPFGVFFRRGKSDPMRRYYEADAATYWSERALGRSASTQRARQF